MGIDKDGHFSFLKCLAIGAAIAGALLCVAAVTVLTAGVGTATGAVAVGTAKGALIGAAIGTATGAVIGGAKTGWSPEGILIGAGLGFGGGAILGAVIGGASGAISHAKIIKFMVKMVLTKKSYLILKISSLRL